MFRSIKKNSTSPFRTCFSSNSYFSLERIRRLSLWFYWLLTWLSSTASTAFIKNCLFPEKIAKHGYNLKADIWFQTLRCPTLAQCMEQRKWRECKVTVKHVSLFAQRKESYTFKDTRYGFFLLLVLKISCYVKWSLIQQNTSNKVNRVFSLFRQGKKLFTPLRFLALLC